MTKSSNRLILFCLALVMAVPAFAVGASNSYKIVAEVLDSGGSRGSSTSYQLLGKTRERELQTPGNSVLTIGEGFLRCVYFPRIIFAPIVTAIKPASALNTGPVAVTISGANFKTGATVKITSASGQEIAGTKVIVVDSGKITCEFDLSGAPSGLWNVTVTNPDGRSGTLPSGFKIIHPAPTIGSVAPVRGVNNEVISLTINGGNFRAGAKVKLSKAGENDIIAEKVAVVSTEKITCTLDLRKKAVGIWDIRVDNEDGQYAVLYQIFKIEAPEIEVLVPAQNKPNPFNPAKEPTIISYTLSQDYDIVIDIFNVRGERVWQYRAASGTMGGMVGQNVVSWNGVTAFRDYASEGVYFLYVTARVKGEQKVLSRVKMAITR